MKITLPTTYGKPLYKVEFRPNGYHIDGKRVKRTTTVLERYPDTKEGLLNWSKERVAITAARLLKDRIRTHPQTGNKFCYFPADQIDAIINTAYLNPDDIKDETAETGNAVHAFCSEWLMAGATEERRIAINNNYYLPPNPDLLQLLHERTDTRLMPDTERNLFYDKMKSYMFNRFCKEWTASGLTCVGSEIVVGSRKYGVGGRVDILARDKKKRLVLPDIKTTKYVAPKMFAQLAAYKLQFEEMYGEKIHRAFIIQLPREWSIKNMGFGVYERPLAKYKGTFLHLLRNWKETEFSSAEKCRKDKIS